jgi:hypothetical protein
MSGLLYAAVAQGDDGFKVIGEHPNNKKNLSETVTMILSKLQQGAHKRTLTQSMYIYDLMQKLNT